MEDNVDVLVLGGGITGLTCALHLERLGQSCRIIDTGKIGGKLQTEGPFDVGFQTVLSSYPNLALAELNLDNSYKLPSRMTLLSAITDSESCEVSRLGSFGKDFRSIFNSSLWTLTDRVTLAHFYLKIRSIKEDPNLGLSYRSISIGDFLRRSNLSYRIVDCFIEPFLRGIYLSRYPLNYNALSFINLIRYFASGSALIPKGGMHDLILQLKNRVKSIWEECKISQIAKNTIKFSNHNNFSFKKIIFAGLEPLLSSTDILSPTLKDNITKNINFEKINDARSEPVDCFYFEGVGSSELMLFRNSDYISMIYNPVAKAYCLVSQTNDRSFDENVHQATLLARSILKDSKYLKGFRLNNPVWRNLPNLDDVRVNQIDNVFFHNRNLAYQDSIDSAIRAGYELAHTCVVANWNH